MKTKTKPPKARNTVVQVHIARKGAGAGFHSSRGYTRKVKHKSQGKE